MDKILSLQKLIEINRKIGNTNPSTQDWTTLFNAIAKVYANEKLDTQYFGKALWGVGETPTTHSAPDVDWVLGETHTINMPFACYLDKLVWWFNMEAYTTDSDRAANVKFEIVYHLDNGNTITEDLGEYGTTSTSWDQMTFNGERKQFTPSSPITSVDIKWYVQWTAKGTYITSGPPHYSPPPASSTAYAREHTDGGVITFYIRRA